jgi:hypothetical protein
MYLKDNYKINKELMLCTNVREIPLAIWSYYLLLSVYRMIVFSKKNWIKIAWDLNFIVFNISLRHVKLGWFYFCVQIST